MTSRRLPVLAALCWSVACGGGRDAPPAGEVDGGVDAASTPDAAPTPDGGAAALTIVAGNCSNATTSLSVVSSYFVGTPLSKPKSASVAAATSGWRARVAGQPRSSTPASRSAVTDASSAAPAAASQSRVSVALQAAG